MIFQVFDFSKFLPKKKNMHNVHGFYFEIGRKIMGISHVKHVIG
jgi:hypothetical protein